MEQSPLPSAPVATYRLQFHHGFTLRHAVNLVPCLEALGITHLYASPLLKAVPGSAHGYDVCDPTMLNPELGAEPDLDALVRALRERNMGLVLDIVPNHMGVGGLENEWWRDVLEHGRNSAFADYFDIDWDSPDPDVRGKVLLPVLGDELDRVLERGELQLVRESNRVVARYFDHRFPIRPESLPSPAVPAMDESNETTLVNLNASPQALRELLERQHYRLAFWRLGDRKLNYRRFFTITSLAGLRVELPRVFDDVHRLVLKWHRDGLLDGLRIDHPDGLYDPAQYLQRLRQVAPNAWIVVEKILMPGEELRTDWPVQGTTGYDFLNRVGGLFVDPTAETAFTKFYAEFTGVTATFESVLLEKKRFVLADMLCAEVDRLASLLHSVAAAARQDQAISGPQAKETLIELAACWPVYRTYIQADSGTLSAGDVECVGQAAARARLNRPDLAPALDFIRDVLLLRIRPGRSAEFVMRFQQLTGPAMAKGAEDTAFYCYNRFVVLNEVGGDPGRFGLSPDAFHAGCVRAQNQWPLSLLATSTHDTKRSEDVRARLSVLSEIPEAWFAAVRQWSALLERHRQQDRPDRNAEYLFYQTLVGAWPLPADRALAFARKAAREARTFTSWSDPNPAYELALEHFITAALSDPEFVASVKRFVTPLIEPGHVNALAQTLIKLTAPGVPDLYQGTELWDLSLVDPDNRRPVDFEVRGRLLNAARELAVEEIWNRREEGLPKLFLIRKALALRRQHVEWFGPASIYEPLQARGIHAGRVIAFRRGEHLVSAAPRLVLNPDGNWADTALDLPAGHWRNELTDELVPGGLCRVADLLKHFPVALLGRL